MTTVTIDKDGNKIISATKAPMFECDCCGKQKAIVTSTWFNV